MEKFFSSDIEKNENNIIQFLARFCLNENDVGEVMDFIGDVVGYCKNKYYAEATRPIPSLSFEYFDADTTMGEYLDSLNRIQISEEYIEDVLTDQETGVYNTLISLIKTIAHEMKHYHQASAVEEFDELPVEKQEEKNKELRQTISDYKNYHFPKQDEIKFLHKFFSPNPSSMLVPEGYTSMEEYYQDVAFSFYFSLGSEEQARDASYEILDDIAKLCKQQNIEYFTDLADKIEAYSARSKAMEEVEEVHSYSVRDRFKSDHLASVDYIKELIEDYEGVKKVINSKEASVYKRALKILLEDKSLKQKQELLKNGIYNGFELSTGTLVELISKDIEFKKYSDEIKSFVFKALIDDYGGRQTNSMRFDAFSADYGRVLTQEQFELLIGNEIINGRFSLAEHFRESTRMFVSSESVLEYYRLARAKDLDSHAMLSAENFFYYTFNDLTIDQKVDFLTRGIGTLDKEMLKVLRDTDDFDNMFLKQADELRKIFDEAFEKAPIYFQEKGSYLSKYKKRIKFASAECEAKVKGLE